MRAPAPGARELCAGGAIVLVAYAVAPWRAAPSARERPGTQRARWPRRATVCGGSSAACFPPRAWARACRRARCFCSPLRARHGLAPPASVGDARPRGPLVAKGAPAETRGAPRAATRARARAARPPRGARGFVPGRLEARRRRRFPGRRARRGRRRARPPVPRAAARRPRGASLRAAVPGFFSGAGSSASSSPSSSPAPRAPAPPAAVIEEEETAATTRRRGARGSRCWPSRARLEAALADGAFWKIFVLAALPNPFFDLCGPVRLARRVAGHVFRRVLRGQGARPDAARARCRRARRAQRGARPRRRGLAAPRAAFWPCRRSCSRARQRARADGAAARHSRTPGGLRRVLLGEDALRSNGLL